jgi:MFS family permease
MPAHGEMDQGPARRRTPANVPADADRAGTASRPLNSSVIAVAALIGVAFAGSVIVTPLYPLYQRAFGFSEITLTLVYATYVLGNVVALVLFGQLSDQIGRKRSALPALGLAAVSALVVAAQAARSMPLLLAATAIAGATVALGYRGSLQVVNEIAPQDRRAEVVSSYYIACFVGNSIPVIGLGVLSALIRPLPATIVFACTVAGLAVAALVWRRQVT